MELGKISSLVFYILFFSASAFLLYLGNKKNSKMLKFMAILIPILIGGLRYFVGTDYTNYIDYYTVYGSMPLESYLSKNGIFEILFYFIARISFLATHNYYLLFFVSNLLIVIFTFLATEKNTIKNKYLIWLLFLFLYFPMFLNAVRQGISISITFYMIMLILNGEYKKSLIISLLSPLFHASGVITILLYIILYYLNRNVKKTRQNVIIISLISMLFIPIGFYLIHFIPYLNQYSKYESIIAEGNNYTFYLKAMILIILFIFYKGVEKQDNNTFYYYLIFASEVVLTLLGFISPFIKRITLYFSLGQILILSCLVEIGANDFSKNALKLLVIIYAISYFILAYYILGQSDIFPFQTIKI